jgi:GNAT superfamily N-acetyltransferase
VAAKSVIVQPVTTRRQLKQFVKLPYRLYRGDPNWVPQLLVDDYKKLDRSKHPFFQHAEAEFFLATREGRPVGRIAAMQDRLWEQVHGERTAYWGWFECENDREVAAALFDAARRWAGGRGCVRIIGPLTPSPAELVGMLVKGFDGPPVIQMSYNPRYYPELVEASGGRKWKDLIAWLIDNPEIPRRLERIMPKVEQRGKFAIRKVNLRNFAGELERFKKLYNEFEQVNEVFTPMTDAEIEYMGNDLKMAIDSDVVFFAEVDGKAVGVSFALPDWNIGFRAARGRLFPFGILKILLAKRKIHLIRVLSMGVLREYRNRGIDLAFYYYSYKYGVPKGYYGAEMSWVEEDNAAMTNTAMKLGGKPYRAYRVYEEKL